eukprot:gene11745-biopygen9441
MSKYSGQAGIPDKLGKPSQATARNSASEQVGKLGQAWASSGKPGQAGHGKCPRTRQVTTARCGELGKDSASLARQPGSGLATDTPPCPPPAWTKQDALKPKQSTTATKI